MRSSALLRGHCGGYLALETLLLRLRSRHAINTELCLTAPFGQGSVSRYGAATRGSGFLRRILRQQLFLHISGHVGQAEMPALEFVGQARMIDAEAVQNCSL